MLKYLLGNGNLFGCLAALAVLGCFLLDIIVLPGSGLAALTLAAYTAGALAGYALARPEPALPATLSSEEALHWLRQYTLPKLPSDVQPSLAHVLDQAAALLPRLHALEQAGNVDPESRMQLKQTLLKHLPQSLDAYLRLPPLYAKVASAGQGGATPHQLLLQQLQLLGSGMDELERKVYSGDLNQLLAQSQLLEAKFGKPPLL